MATEIEQMLIEYGKNAENRKLQSYYSHKSYMEKLGIARAEEPHNAYWANLLIGDDVNCDKNESPLMWFLQVLANRESTATSYGTNSLFLLNGETPSLDAQGWKRWFERTYNLNLVTPNFDLMIHIHQLELKLGRFS